MICPDHPVEIVQASPDCQKYCDKVLLLDFNIVRIPLVLSANILGPSVTERPGLAGL